MPAPCAAATRGSAPHGHTSPGDGRHVVPREHAREPRPQRCALEPAIPTLLQHAVRVALAQLQLVALLGLVGIERQVPAAGEAGR